MKKKIIKQIAVEVTKKDIRKGKQYSPKSCPIALSLSRKCNIGTDDILVVSNILLNTGNFYGFYRHSKASLKFMEKFDGGFSVKPARFIFKKLKNRGLKY